MKHKSIVSEKTKQKNKPIISSNLLRNSFREGGALDQNSLPPPPPLTTSTFWHYSMRQRNLINKENVRCCLNKQLVFWRSWGWSHNPVVVNPRANRGTHTGVWQPGLTIVCCINIVIAASQVEGNGECLCQFDFLTFRLSRLSSSSALILIIPVKLRAAPCTLLRFSAAAAYRLCHSLWQGRQEAQHSFIQHKGRPVQLDKYYFLPLTAPPVKLVLYYFSLFSSVLLFVSPHHHAPSAPIWGLTQKEKEEFKSRD